VSLTGSRTVRSPKSATRSSRPPRASAGDDWAYRAAATEPAGQVAGHRVGTQSKPTGLAWLAGVWVTSGLTFNLSVLFSSASTLLRVPLFLLALLVVRGLPAVLYRSALASIRDVAAAGLLQATSLPFIVAATTIGLQLHAIRPANAAALVAAGLSASSFFPSSRCSCCDRLLKGRAWSRSRRTFASSPKWRD
jgi:hypothetical protein